MPVYAGIDIGTLTLRLLIARIEDDGILHELGSERRIVRLGEGLQQTGRLHQRSMERAVETILGWIPLLGRAGVEHVTAAATSAVRDAVNRAEFLEQVQRETGLEVEVLAGEEEARRTLLGIQAGLPKGVEQFLALDIGGGSTEFIKFCPGAPPVLKSIDEGIVRLTEDCLRGDPVTSEDVATASERLRKHLQTVAQALGDEGKGRVLARPGWAGATEGKGRVPARPGGAGAIAGYQLIGTAGSITTLAAMDQWIEVFDSVRIHNYRLSLEAVRRIIGEVIPLSSAERRGLPGVEPGREDFILAGAMILEQTMQQFGFHDCLVSDYGLREGLLIDRWQKTRRGSSSRSATPDFSLP
jgi:exopolyphosphatase/guanosine-5'-triphosphate,3'-diphosphate pyrophosphatase